MAWSPSAAVIGALQPQDRPTALTGSGVRLSQCIITLFTRTHYQGSSSHEKLQAHRCTGRSHTCTHLHHPSTLAVGRSEPSRKPCPSRLARSPTAVRYMTQVPLHKPTLSSPSADRTKADLLTAPSPAAPAASTPKRPSKAIDDLPSRPHVSIENGVINLCIYASCLCLALPFAGQRVPVLVGRVRRDA
jgi:hypothetical protein